MAELHQVADAGGDATIFEITTEEISIGRSDSCEVIILDKAVSRRHAMIRSTDDGLLLVDNGSANGTFVNGVKIGEHQLVHDDLVRIGSSTLRFVDPPDPEATLLLDAGEEVKKAREEMKRERDEALAPPPMEAPPVPPQAPPEVPTSPPPVAAAPAHEEAASAFPPPVPAAAPAAEPTPPQPPSTPAVPPPVVMPDPPAGTAQPVSPPPVVMPDRPALSVAAEASDLPQTHGDGRPYAGFWIRLAAYLIDGFIVGVAVMLINLPAIIIGVTLGARQQALAAIVGILCALLGAAGSVLYFAYFWATRGATPGKKLLKLEIIRDDDLQPLGWGKAWMRLLGYIVSGAVMDIGFIMIAFTERKRGLHDMIAHTLVVKNPS